MKNYLFACYFLLVIFQFPYFLAAEETAQKKTICLNMIVKNETKVIRRCLDSVRPIIDYWVISDTGSSDGTQDMIKEHMKDIPGELYERPWLNFGHNRNEALQLAKGKADYILFIDADEILLYDKDFKLPELDKDFYYIMTHFNGTVYARVQLINGALNWKWIGVLHEALDAPGVLTADTLKGVINEVHTDGARSEDPEKYKKDVKILEEGLRNEPNNTRYMFYLAQSYKDAGDHENSLKYYKKRIEMGGWQEEVFWSMFQVAFMEQLLNMPESQVAESYLKAYYYRPTRIEPLYNLTRYYRDKQQYNHGYLVGSIAAKIPAPPNDLLFVQKWMYDYHLPLELSICAYWTGKYQECADVSAKILEHPNLPANIRTCVERNMIYANEKIGRYYYRLYEPVPTLRQIITLSSPRPRLIFPVGMQKIVGQIQ